MRFQFNTWEWLLTCNHACSPVVAYPAHSSIYCCLCCLINYIVVCDVLILFLDVCLVFLSSILLFVLFLIKYIVVSVVFYRIYFCLHGWSYACCCFQMSISQNIDGSASDDGIETTLRASKKYTSMEEYTNDVSCYFTL
jgi:hypothetical protein